jgi:tRNA pseudouridine55 synthase
MKSLLRTRVGQFSAENSLKLSEINELAEQGKIMDSVIKVDDMFPDYSKVYVAEEYCKYIYNGNSFMKDDLIQLKQDDLPQSKQESILINSFFVRVYDWEGNFVGIYEFDQTEEKFKPVKMFL